MMQRYNRTEPITRPEVYAMSVSIGYPLMRWQLDVAVAALNSDNVMIIHPRLTAWRSVHEVIEAFKEKET